TNALTNVTAYVYCPCGALETMTAAAGTPVEQVTTFTTDNQGNQTRIVYSDGYTVNYAYDSWQRTTNVADALESIASSYNNQGLLVASDNAFGQQLKIIYDLFDRATNTVDANGVSVSNTYDTLDRLLIRSYPDGGVEKYVSTLNFASSTSSPS